MNSGVRYLMAVTVAIMVTLSAFYLMHHLISGAAGERVALEPPPGIYFGPVEIDPDIDRKTRPSKPEELPPPEMPPPPPETLITKVERDQQLIDFETPVTDQVLKGSGPVLTPFGNHRREGDIVPLVRIQPVYPRNEAMNGVEGFVTVEFTITETGSVVNPRVIDSNPPRVFDREAERAILRWKFKPQIINGEAVSRTAIQTLDFTLEGS